MNSSNADDDSDSDLDPRIQTELENLNSKTDEINKLEIDLENANTYFRKLLNESTERLKELAKSNGSAVNKARPYHQAMSDAQKAQIECQKAAINFQRASEIHRAAKETVTLAEQRFISKQADWTFDSAWQDMLNHATMKVSEAEIQKALAEKEHQMRAVAFIEAETRVKKLHSESRFSILRSQSYFNEKEAFDKKLSEQKAMVGRLQIEVAKAKQDYKAALGRLEVISDEIHFRRTKGPREPGVGAELVNEIIEEVAAVNVNKTAENCDKILKAEAAMKPQELIMTPQNLQES
ncbi:SH3 domain-binding protein 5 homolog [Neocloeon triangulifer]|uniref:SH3 domain-binding protein 5 homolog n=1 Tax=Neocloeon triangulifer TaxID=2078957 RepID=UPI00286F272B|nr:SH3 domain-binding protein 5 homolog [Neocloeon triangulifer]